MEYFWKKKLIVSYIMSIFVLFVHVSSFGGADNYFPNILVRIVVVRNMPIFAVRLFFIISGMLFFKNYSNKDYLRKLKSRIKTLLIPYLIWNIVWLIFEIVTSYTPISLLFTKREKFVITAGSILEGVFHYGCNSVFWFVFQLMALHIISPLIYYLIRKKSVGIIFSVMFIILSDYISDPTGLFFNLSASVYYIVGGIIGMHFFEWMSKKCNKKVAVTYLILFFATVVLESILDYNRVDWSFSLKIPVRLISAISFWRLSDLFIDKLPAKEYFKYSFAVYAMHINVQSVVCRVIYMIVPRNVYWAIPNFIGTVFLTLLIINTFCFLVNKYFPRIYKVIMGERC